MLGPMKCEKCTIVRKTKIAMQHDDATKKDWLITKCGVCGFNIDLEETRLLPGPKTPWKL